MTVLKNEFAWWSASVHIPSVTRATQRQVFDQDPNLRLAMGKSARWFDDINRLVGDRNEAGERQGQR